MQVEVYSFNLIWVLMSLQR